MRQVLDPQPVDDRQHEVPLDPRIISGVNRVSTSS